MTIDLSELEIADELIVSASTVRSHIKNIYSKLDAHSQHEAIKKAKDLVFFEEDRIRNGNWRGAGW